MNKVISVALVDDHPLVRQGIRTFLSLAPGLEVVAEGDSGEAAVRIASEFRPDVMLLDLVMPRMNGIEATQQIKEANPQTQVIILTSFADEDQVVPALRAGALSYILKECTGQELITVIEKAARGDATLHPRVANHVVQAVRDAGSDILLQLSDREHEVLLLIGKGYSNGQIAQHLVISERTVKSHVSSILSKLNMTDRTQLAVFAWQRGLLSRFTQPHATQL